MNSRNGDEVNNADNLISATCFEIEPSDPSFEKHGVSDKRNTLF